jgi:hypothetical protein
MLKSLMAGLVMMVVAPFAHADCAHPVALYDALVIAEIRGGSATQLSASAVALVLTKLRHYTFTADAGDPPTWLADDLKFYDAAVVSLLSGAAALRDRELVASDAIRFHKTAIQVLDERARSFPGLLTCT